MKKIVISLLTILLIGIIILFITKIETTKAATTTLADKVISLSKGTSWSSGASGVYRTNSHEYRYVGANVNNYVKFNDDMYRIIGVFDSNSTGVSGNLVKLIRARSIGSYSWGALNHALTYYDENENSITVYYHNSWPNGNLYKLLNVYFLDKTDTSTSAGLCSDWTYVYRTSSTENKTEDCSDIVGYGIKSTQKSYIQPVTWFLKGYKNNTHSKQDFYTCERSDTTTITDCDKSNSHDYDYTKITNKYIGLMYVSDYLYASGYYSSSDTTTANNMLYGTQNWLNNGMEWTITPVGSSSKAAFNIYRGNVNSNYNTFYALILRPTFYLKSTVNYVSGTGTFDNPFIISM